MSIAQIDTNIEQAAYAHQKQLTKPPGALGRLEDVACWFAARQGKVKPDPLRPVIIVFAADHGVSEEGVSAFPSAVTAEMVKNFVHGGAAINVLAEQCGAAFAVVDVGVASDLSALDGVVHARVQAGTHNLCREAAMSEEACAKAIEVGQKQADVAINAGANVLIAGDMGIGNTTASACLICRYIGASPKQVVGRGTGIDDAAYQQKLQVVEQALQRTKGLTETSVLAQLGGLEIAAMAGFYTQAAKRGVPVVIDGFIASAAALAAKVMEPRVADWMLASHISHETGHALVLQSLGLQPWLDFSMRLGEGSGAALLLPLLNSAIALHNDMATFESAGISQ